MRAMRDGNDTHVFVFTDESYVNTNHGSGKSYMFRDASKNMELKLKSGKGRRLVILHSITLDGPLCDYLDNGFPVDNLK